MNRQVLLAGITGLVIGMSGTSFLKNSQQSSRLQLTSDAAKVTSAVAQKYIDAYNKLNDQNAVLFALAKSYEDAKVPEEKSKIADGLVFKIREFNFPMVK